MSPCLHLPLSLYMGFPRVSGDEPGDRKLGGRDTKFSPRERG